MAEDSNRTAFDACCRAAEPGAPRVRRTSILTRGALPGRGLKSDRRRRRLYVAPRERRRDGRRVREGPLRVCGDPASRSRRDAGPGAHKNRRSSARSRPPRRAVPERRVMARTRCCAYEVTHGAYTWPRLATERRPTPAAADATPYPARHGYSTRPFSCASRYRRAE